MNRAMFSGVAGLKTHQTKMDVIGNNIANVNTYGFKSQRAVFSDIYYQTLKSGTKGSNDRGGVNPSSVGYGSGLGAVQTQMSSSSLQNTGFGLDTAIAGEGFFQVMDSDGNIFYTKAGLLDYDANTGYLTDINGNFVLGSTGADGKPGSNKIKLDGIGSVEPAKSKATQTINGMEFTLEASKSGKAGNTSISISASEDLPAGQKVKATISTTGAINVQLNAYEKFTDLATLNSEINKAIKEANQGKEHQGGTFTLSAKPAKTGTTGTTATAITWPLTGAEISGVNFGVVSGSITGNIDEIFDGNMTIKGVSKDFTEAGDVNLKDIKAKYTAAAGTAKAYWEISMTVGGKTYTGKIDEDTKSKSLLLKRADGSGGSIEVSNPGMDYFTAKDGGAPTTGSKVEAGVDPKKVSFTASTKSKDLGLSSTAFALTGGTEGGTITMDQLSSIAIGTDGTVTVSHPEKGLVVAGKISLANFANPAGLQLEGTNYYSVSGNSGDPKLCDPGSNGSGALRSSALEMSNVDLSGEFADMITTQRGFQANSRIITVSDTMLEELINLKR